MPKKLCNFIWFKRKNGRVVKHHKYRTLVIWIKEPLNPSKGFTVHRAIIQEI